MLRLEYNGDREKVKVLFYSFYFPPATPVGAKRAAAMCKALTDNDLNVEIRAFQSPSSSISKRHKRDGQAVNRSEGGSSIGMGGLRSAIARLRVSRYFRSLDATIFSRFFWGNVWRVLSRRDGPVDIVIATYKPSANILLGWLASKIYKARLVVDLRDLISIFGRKKRVWGLHWIDAAIDKCLVRSANLIIVVSPTQKSKAEEFYGRTIELIYNGTESSETQRADEKEEVKESYIFYAGTLSPDRELGRVSEFLNRYNQTKELKLYVASIQDPRHYGGHSDHISWLGYLPRDSVQDWIARSKGLVILEGLDSSAAENIPAKLYEYIGARKPVIADCYEHSDLVKLLQETKCGAHVANYQDFCDVIEADMFCDEAALKYFTRESQMADFIALLKRQTGQQYLEPPRN